MFDTNTTWGIFFVALPDDLILGIPKSKTTDLSDTFSVFNSNIKFTVEEEKANSVSFLDILIIGTN